MNGLDKVLCNHVRKSCQALKKAMESDNHCVEDCGDSVDAAPQAACEQKSSNACSGGSYYAASSTCDTTNSAENSRCRHQVRTNSGSGMRQTNTSSYFTVQQSSSRDESVVDLVRIKEEAMSLGRDIVIYMSSKTIGQVPTTSNKHAETLRRTVDNLSERHEIPFASMTKKLRIGEPGTSCQSIVGIADEMFSDGQYNWGRVITLYAFAGWLARYCAENNIGGNWIEKIGETVGSYVANHLGDWIARQGGWEDMDRFFPPGENMESKIWRGLLYTMLGLGALATTVAAVR